MRYNGNRKSVSFRSEPTALLGGDFKLVIRPFQLGDLYLIQRLSHQAICFPCAQSFLQPHAMVPVALSSILPRHPPGTATYVLRQKGHGLVHEGALQLIRRAGRPEADILRLAPSIAASSGHPAIWTKLLLHLAHEAPSLAIDRLYADVPEQPLLVNTFVSVGFQPYCRQTVWRHFAPSVTAAQVRPIDTVRPRAAVDDWALLRLYTRTVPAHVQAAEGAIGESATQPPFMENNHTENSVTYIAFDAESVAGAFQLTEGRSGTWLYLWADTLQPDSTMLHVLVGQALRVVANRRWPAPLYVASSDFHGALETVLNEFGFAPFSDRVRMVKHVVKWVRESIATAIAGVETPSEVVPTSFASHGAAPKSVSSSATIDSGKA